MTTDKADRSLRESLMIAIGLVLMGAFLATAIGNILYHVSPVQEVEKEHRAYERGAVRMYLIKRFVPDLMKPENRDLLENILEQHLFNMDQGRFDQLQAKMIHSEQFIDLPHLEDKPAKQ